MKLSKIHFLSGIIISVFVFLHLFNHLASLGGAESHIEVMNILRVFYRNIFAETLLILAVSVQVISGILLIRNTRKLTVVGFEKLRIWSGMYLAFFLIMHTSAVFLGRALLHLDTNYYFGVAGLVTFPFYLFFGPYYGLAILAFFAHLASIHYYKMKYDFLGVSPNMQSKMILLIGIVITFLILFGLTNQLRGVVIPEVYQIMIGG